MRTSAFAHLECQFALHAGRNSTQDVPKIMGLAVSLQHIGELRVGDKPDGRPVFGDKALRLHECRVLVAKRVGRQRGQALKIDRVRIDTRLRQMIAINRKKIKNRV